MSTSFNQGIVLPKTSGLGIQVDPAAPSWGWRDMIGVLRPDLGGANAPTLNVFRGGLIREYAYVANDKMDKDYHIPHDYVPGTDMFCDCHYQSNNMATKGKAPNFYV